MRHNLCSLLRYSCPLTPWFLSDGTIVDHTTKLDDRPLVLRFLLAVVTRGCEPQRHGDHEHEELDTTRVRTLLSASGAVFIAIAMLQLSYAGIL